jgi:hypothetical protein
MSSTTAVVCCTLLVLLTINWATTTLAGIEEPLSRADLYAFITAVVATLVVQLIITLLVHKVAKSSLVTMALTSVLCVANAWSMHLILVEGYMELPDFAKVILLSAASLLIFFLLRAASNSRAWFHTACAGVFAFIALNVAGYAFAGNETASAKPESYDLFKPMTVSDKIKKVKFERTPNVYLIGFESAGPAPVLQKYMGLSNAPLPRALDERGFRIFPNAFSEGSPTRVSWHALLAMDVDYATDVQTKLGGGQLFSGAKPSPLMEIFKYNGYEITTLYKSSYLGTMKGPYIDRLVLAKSFSPCDSGFVSKMVAHYLFWGACSIRSEWFPDGGEPADPITQLTDVVAAAGTAPQLIIAHTDKPVHTPTGGLWRGSEAEVVAFRKNYTTASEAAVVNLDRILGAIRAVDETGIILVFGDHGPTLSRAQKLEQDPAFYVQDRYGVLAAVHPKEACKETFDDPGSIGYYTTPQLARLVVKCLAGGVDPFVVPYTHQIRTKHNTIDLGNYLYE